MGVGTGGCWNWWNINMSYPVRVWWVLELVEYKHVIPYVVGVGSRALNLQVESTQNMIRIVGLSATLPNYLDVAHFLRVNPFKGLFFFDGRFRPVPLSQAFVGVKTPNRIRQLKDMEEVCYEKVLTNVTKGYQVCTYVCMYVHMCVELVCLFMSSVYLGCDVCNAVCLYVCMYVRI